MEQTDGFKRKCIGTELKFIILPKICALTGKKLMFQFVYKQTAFWMGPGESIFEYRYYDKNEFLVARLKGIV